MTNNRSDFLREITERGFVHQLSDEQGLDNAAGEKRLIGYTGFDATADSLHVGSLVQIMLLRRLQQAGHKPIVLMGGGTTKVGDPSGKDEARRLLTQEQIDTNIAGIKTVFESFLTFGDGPSDALMVNNQEWLDRLGYIDFLRDYGRHFSVNRMLTFESVKLRLEREQPLSFLEFNYNILQAYDFVELFRRYGCSLQMGGREQWANIISGIDLGRRVCDAQLFALTTPLITTADGKKMGKTAAGAVWLNEDRLPSYDYWQFWRNTADADVGRFLRLFTDLPLDEISRLEALQGTEINDAKKILATEATRMARGEAAATHAAETARKTFEAGQAADGLPQFDISMDRLSEGVPAIDLLQEAGLTNSKGEARRLIRGGGARINDTPIADEAMMITTDHIADGIIKMSAGKKRHAVIRAAED